MHYANHMKPCPIFNSMELIATITMMVKTLQHQKTLLIDDILFLHLILRNVKMHARRKFDLFLYCNAVRADLLKLRIRMLYFTKQR